MKLGLVLEGGASRSLFTCGVLDALLEEDIFADLVIGVSAGIAYGTSYVSKQIGRNLELSTKYMHDKRYMGIRHLLNPKNRSYYNREFAFHRIPKELVLFDFDAYTKNAEGCEVYAVLTNLETGNAEYSLLSSNDWDRHINTLWASCALPLLFQPEYIDGVPYLDGGVADPIPYHKAIELGCDKIITVLTREKSYRKEGDGSAKLAGRFFKKYSGFCKALNGRSEKYNQTRDELFAKAEAGEAFVIMPTSTEGFNRTERRPEKLKALYDDGYSVAKQMMPQIKKYLNS